MPDKAIDTTKPQATDDAFDLQLRIAAAVGASSVCNLGDGGAPASQPLALAANPARRKLFIQNVGPNKLYIRFGAGASTSHYDRILTAASAQGEADGGSMENNTYSGTVTVAGDNPSYIASEEL